MRILLRAALLGATVLTPATAWAQDTAAAPETAAPGATEGNEVVVTARKREERLQDAPTSVAVATARTIENLGLDSVADIAKTTPGLVFDDTFGRDSNRPVIRGQANILGQSGVAYFIDGIYYSGSIADYDVDSIERLEVVKGPQSALYGRNTYSGAINIISKSPGNSWQGGVTADIAEHDRYELSAGIRGPIADGLGIALNGRWYDYGGEFTNLYDGQKVGQQSTWSLGGMLKYDNGGPVTASLRANYNNTDDGQPALFAQTANANNCFPDNGALYRGQRRYYCGVIQPQPINTDYRRQFVNAEDVGLESKTFNAALRLDAELGERVTLTSLTGYNKRTSDTRTDGDYSGNSFNFVIFAYGSIGPIVGATAPRNLRYSAFATSVQDFSFSNHSDTDDWSQELRLNYEGDRFKLMAGGYYFRQNDDTRDTRVVPPGSLALAQANANAATTALCAALANCGAFVPVTITAANLPESRNTNNFDIRNQAIFGSVQVDLTDQLSITAEGRYAEEKIVQSTQTYNNGAVAPAPSVVRATFKKFTPRVTLDWKATPDNLLYAIYAEGQKPGGFNSNQAIVAGFPTFAPENVKSYEVGTKNTFLNGTLTANLAVFHNNITGYQITQNISVPPNQVSLTRNGGDARVNGAELSLLMRPDRNLTITANYAYANTKFTQGTDENLGLIVDLTDDGLANCSTGDQFPAITGCQSAYASIKGKRIPRAPEHTAFVDVDWRHPIGQGDWTAFLGGNVSMTSTSYDQVLNFASTGGSAVVDVRAGFQNGRFRVQGYVKNLFDEDSVLQILRYADANADLRRNFVAGLRPGRRIGVIVSAKF